MRKLNRIALASAVIFLASAGIGRAQPALIGEFGAWKAFKVTKAGETVCFASTSPRARFPVGLQRDPAHLAVTERPGDSVADEISIQFGYAVNEDGPSRLNVGEASFDLMEDGEAAWLEKEHEQPKAVDALKREWVATVETTSTRGNDTTDEYSLKGFSKAYEAITEACG